MDEISDRRQFFKGLLGKGLTRGVEHVDRRLEPVQRSLRLVTDPPSEPPREHERESAPEPAPDPVRLAPATPATATCSAEDLMRLAAENGLSRRVEAVCALARQSVRLVPADGAPTAAEAGTARDDAAADPAPIAAPIPAPFGRSRLGGAPDLPDSRDWPVRAEMPLDFIAQIDLTAAAAAGLSGSLPTSGLLLLFLDITDVPATPRPDHADSCQIILVADDELAAAGPPVGEGGVPLALSVELTLPRVWSAAVRVLDLDADEQEGWQRVRKLLADRQGVELEDLVRERHALHRLLGYPDEKRGAMPLSCELAARGIDVGDGTPAVHPRASELESAALSWRLLAQFTLDGDLGAEWGARRDRLYAWVHEDRLAAGDLSAVWAIAQ